MTRRRPSPAKQRRRDERPRGAMRATAWRWPAISPGGHLVGARSGRTGGHRIGGSLRPPGRRCGPAAPGRVARHPEPPRRDAAGGREPRARAGREDAARRAPVVEAVAQEAHDGAARGDGSMRQGGADRRGGLGRQEDAPLGQGGAFFQMQVGDHEQASPAEIERARGEGYELRASHRTWVGSPPRQAIGSTPMPYACSDRLGQQIIRRFGEQRCRSPRRRRARGRSPA